MGDTDPMIGRVLHGTILLRRQIGSGGMGNVYEGYQEHLDRVVAVKILTPEHARNPVAAEYFLREARAASKLRHPNIIQIIDYGKEEEDGTLFMAMEFVPGLPLGRIIRKEFPLPTSRMVTILDQTLAGLAVAHTKQIVHRDLKPDNLMVETFDGRDFVKILDFGIAQSQAPQAKVGPLTRQGAIVGTPQYMSPEQAMADAVDARSDLFSLGTILYEMLTQTSPFAGKNLPDILIAVTRHHPPPPSAVRPDADIDPRLEAICLRAMKKEPDLRYQSAEEFRAALKTVGAPETAKAQPAAPAQFIFKRNKSKVTPARTMASENPRSPTLESHERGPQPHTPAPSPSTFDEIPAPARPPAPEKPRKSKGLGFDVAELRGDLLGERMRVVAVVAHQRSSKRIDAEGMLELRTLLDRVFEEVVKETGGHVHGRQGSFVTILYGIPEPAPNDAERATQAAITLRRRLSKVAPEGTTFSFAVSAGEVFCPEGKLSNAAGPPIDDATEAARAAGDDAIAAVGAISAILETHFRLADMGDDGERLVLGARDAAAAVERAPDATPQLAGRDDEIATILATMGRLSQGKGVVLPIVGEPGVGKSALVAELVRLARQRKFSVALAHARWSGPELVRWVRVRWLLDLLRQHGRNVRDAEVGFREMGAAPEYARLLGSLVNDRLGETFGFVGSGRAADLDADSERAVRVALRALARAVVRERPLVLCIDGLDGYDATLAEAIQDLTELCGSQAVLLALAIRMTPGRPSAELPQPSTPLYVGAIDDQAARAFVKVRLGARADADLVDRIVRVGGGIPLHLEQLARHVRSKGQLTPEDAERLLAQSHEISELLRLRLFSQPKPVQNVLALLSALGDGTIGTTLLDLASREWEPEAAISRLYDDGLLAIEGDEEQPRLYFRPPALRHVVYDQLSRKVRRKIHSRAAAYFADQLAAAPAGPEHDTLVSLALHREKSGDSDGALEALSVLVERELRGFEFQLARAHLEQSLRVLKESRPEASDEAASLELQIVRTDIAIGRRGEAIDRCRRLERSDLSLALLCAVRIQLAELWLEEEDPDLVEKIARGALSDARKLLQERPDDLELRCLLIRALQLVATVHERAARPVQAAKFALEAAEIIERGEVEPTNNPWGPSLIWQTLNQLGRIRLRNRDAAGARKMFELAMRVVTQAQDIRGEVAVRANLAMLSEFDGALDTAYQGLLEALRLARRMSDPRAIAKLEYNRGLVLARQHRLEMAREAFTASLELAEDLDWREGIALTSDELRRIARSLDDPEPAPVTHPSKR